MYQLLASDPSTVAPLARAIDDMFRNSDTQTRTESEQSFQLSIISFLGNVNYSCWPSAEPSPLPCCWFPPTPWP